MHFSRIVSTLGLLALLAVPAQASDFGLLLPPRHIAEAPGPKTLKLTLCAVEPFFGR